MPNKRDYHWTFGNSCKISFLNGGAPSNSGPQSFNTDEGCSSISDTNGNLLFYTDGRKLYNATGAAVTGPLLGGNLKSACSALIVPPAGGGSLYHLFTVGQWDTPSNAGKVTWTPIALGPVAMQSPPAQLGFGPVKAAEKLAAVAHADCSMYWVVSLGIDANLGTFFAMRISGDSGPSAGATVTSNYPATWAPYHQACVKFSPDGSLLAVTSNITIDIFNFNRATGALTPHSQITGFLPPVHNAYGVEFSPDGRFLYYSSSNSGAVRRHIIGSGGAMIADAVAGQINGPAQPVIGALQLGPNGKIYGTIYNSPRLFEIGAPNQNVITAVQFLPIALDASGGQLNLNAAARLGLPAFTRIPPECDNRCAMLGDKVDKQLEAQQDVKFNQLRDCKGKEVPGPTCAPLPIPPLAPQIYVKWGDSRCDCIESDDTEIMSLRICNPYSNVTLSNFVVHQVVVVDQSGNPPTPLPDGTPSIQLVPVGPYCFDDIAPCTCVTREFVLRLRGAKAGPYEIRLSGVCFDACIHGDVEACFGFEVCKD